MSELERKVARLEGFLDAARGLTTANSKRANETAAQVRAAFTAGQLATLRVLAEQGLIKAKRPRGRPVTTAERNAAIVRTVESLVAGGMVLKAACATAEAVHGATRDQVRHAWKNRAGQ